MTQSRGANQRIGLVVNPAAGGGREESASIVRKLLTVLRGEQLVLIEDSMESGLAAELGALWTSVLPGEEHRRDARGAAEVLLQQDVDLLIGIGGDGTLCDIASAILAAGSETQLLGIGAGSANVGPLITLLGREVAQLSLDSLRAETIHGIDAFVGDSYLGTAFNDIVFGNTFFGTRNGCRIDLDAAAAIRGEDCTAEPASVCGPKTWIHKNGQPMLENGCSSFAQIIASPLNDAGTYSGKAISGLMCWGPYLGNHGVLAAVNTVMVRTQLSLTDLGAAEPLHLAHLSFGGDDRITIGNLLDDAVLVLDGNPVSHLAPSDVVTLRIRLDALRVLCPPSFARGLDASESNRQTTDRKDPNELPRNDN